MSVMVGVVSMAGCYGSFPLTNTLYEVNGDLFEDDFFNSIVMIVLGIFGVYGICMFVDYLILNSIEYWTEDEINIGGVFLFH